MLAVLHELAKHIDPATGALSRRSGHGSASAGSDFKIVYVAPMKALAAEVAAAFSRRLGALGVAVRELT